MDPLVLKYHQRYIELLNKFATQEDLNDYKDHIKKPSVITEDTKLQDFSTSIYQVIKYWNTSWSNLFGKEEPTFITKLREFRAEIKNEIKNNVQTTPRSQTPTIVVTDNSNDIDDLETLTRSALKAKHQQEIEAMRQQLEQTQLKHKNDFNILCQSTIKHASTHARSIFGEIMPHLKSSEGKEIVAGYTTRVNRTQARVPHDPSFTDVTKKAKPRTANIRELNVFPEKRQQAIEHIIRFIKSGQSKSLTLHTSNSNCLFQELLYNLMTDFKHDMNKIITNKPEIVQMINTLTKPDLKELLLNTHDDIANWPSKLCKGWGKDISTFNYDVYVAKNVIKLLGRNEIPRDPNLVSYFNSKLPEAKRISIETKENEPPNVLNV